MTLNQRSFYPQVYPHSDDTVRWTAAGGGKWAAGKVASHLIK